MSSFVQTYHIRRCKNKTPALKTRKLYPPSVSRVNRILLEIDLNQELSTGEWSGLCGMERADFFNVVKELVDNGYVTKRKATGESGRVETYFTRVNPEPFEREK